MRAQVAMLGKIGFVGGFVVSRAKGSGPFKIDGVKVLKEGLVPLGFLCAVGFGKHLPECRFVCLHAGILHHGGRARPDRIDQRFRLVPVRSELCREEPEIAFRKFVLIHREQRPVQIKQYCLDHFFPCLASISGGRALVAGPVHFIITKIRPGSLPGRYAPPQLRFFIQKG